MEDRILLSVVSPSVLGTRVDLPIAGGEPSSLAVADIDNDGDRDIVTTSTEYFRDGSIEATETLFVGSGDGTFVKQTRPWGSNYSDRHLVDLNGDGRLDSILVNVFNETSPRAYSRVLVALQDASGNFAQVGSYSVQQQVFSMKLSDVNGDGILDILTEGRAYSDRGDYTSLLVRLGAGNGGFGDSIYAGARFGLAALGDVNGDGRTDLVGGFNHASIRGNIRLSNGDGTFGAPNDYGARGFQKVALGDLDGDGDLDIVTASAVGSVTVSMGHGDGSFDLGRSYAVRSGCTEDLVLADWSGDGHLDIVVAESSCPGTGTVMVLLGNGDGTFAFGATAAVGNDAVSLALGDVNNDGDLDIVTVGGDFAKSSVTLLLARRGPGSFQFSTASYLFVENGGTATVTVVRTDGKDGSVTVNYATRDGTAKAGIDYSATAGTLTFSHGEISKTFTIPILDDTVADGSKTVSFSLSNATGGAGLGFQKTATLTIADNEIVGGRSSQFMDDDGDLFTVRLSGSGGLASVLLVDPDGDGHGPIDSIQLVGTTSTHSLQLTILPAIGGDGKLSIQSITGNGSLRSLVAVRSEVTDGGINLSGSIGQIALAGLSGDISAAALGSLVIRGGDFYGDLNVQRTVSSVQVLSSTVKDPDGSIEILGGTVEGDWTVASFGRITISSQQDGGGFRGSLTSTANAATLGATPAIAAISIQGGDFIASINAQGRVGDITVKGIRVTDPDTDETNVLGGGAEGNWTAANFGRITVGGGSVSLTSTAASGALPAIATITVLGGDANLQITTRGNIGLILVGGGADFSGNINTSGTMAGLQVLSVKVSDGEGGFDVVGGNVYNTTIVAHAIQRFLVSEDLTNSSIRAASFGVVMINGSVIDPLTDSRFIVG